MLRSNLTPGLVRHHVRLLDFPFLVVVSGHAVPYLSLGTLGCAAAVHVQALAANPDDLLGKIGVERPPLVEVSSLTVPDLDVCAVGRPAGADIQALVGSRPDYSVIVESPVLIMVSGLALPHLNLRTVGCAAAADVKAI